MQLVLKKILLGIGIFFLFPLGITVVISGSENLKTSQRMDFEKFLPILMCQQIDWDYEEETLKAQAVLVRSSLFLCAQNGELTNSTWRSLMKEYQSKKNERSYQKTYERMKVAVESTKGMVLCMENSVCEGAFHKLSSGYTREGISILKDTSYKYLTRVKSSEDMYHKDYLSGHYFSQMALKERLKRYYPEINWSEDSLFEQIQIMERDESDYVLRVQIGDRIVSGEELRVCLELSSSHFTIQEVEGQIRFLCKGIGHGMGMSQFGANEMAKEGSCYLEILAYYFPVATVKTVKL